MAPRVQEWGAAGDSLVEGASGPELITIAAAAARIQTLATVKLLAGRASPLLMDAQAAAKFLGPSFSAKWLYNHWRQLPPECIQRVGRRVMFRGEPLRAWAVCDSPKSVPRGR